MEVQVLLQWAHVSVSSTCSLRGWSLLPWSLCPKQGCVPFGDFGAGVGGINRSGSCCLSLLRLGCGPTLIAAPTEGHRGRPLSIDTRALPGSPTCSPGCRWWGLGLSPVFQSKGLLSWFVFLANCSSSSRACRSDRQLVEWMRLLESADLVLICPVITWWPWAGYLTFLSFNFLIYRSK